MVVSFTFAPSIAVFYRLSSFFFSCQKAICVSAEPVALKTTPKSAKPYPLAGGSMSGLPSTSANWCQ
jgi:hypothetical protein